MMPRQVVFALVTFFHDLFTVIWIGGLLTMGVILLPSVRKVLGKGEQTKALMDSIQRRLRILVVISIVGLLITGALLSRRAPAFQGLFRFGNPYSLVLGIKHALTLAMIVIAIVRGFGFRRAKAPRQEKAKAALLLLNVAFGILVLLLSGFSAALSQSALGG